MRYRFIDSHKKTWPITLMCQVMAVATSGYYDWRNRPESKQVRLNRVLDTHIHQVFHHHKQRYGVPRVTQELQDQGIRCSVNRVSRRMRSLGLKGIQAKKFKRTTDSAHDKPTAPDLINRDFTAKAPNQKWVSDLTYIWTDQGWLYLAVIMDLYSRAIIGWSMGKRMTQQLICDGLTMALFNRGFPREVIIHSDRGSQYCSRAYQALVKAMGLRCSMGRTGSCYDNAAMESFFHSLKVELIHRERYNSRQQAKRAIFEYIEVYYNRQRKHSAIGYQAPMLFEQKRA